MGPELTMFEGEQRTNKVPKKVPKEGTKKVLKIEGPKIIRPKMKNEMERPKMKDERWKMIGPTKKTGKKNRKNQKTTNGHKSS